MPTTIRQPSYWLIAWTRFESPPHIAKMWNNPGNHDGLELVEFAGRACYSSWNNPSGRTNGEYIKNLLDQGHLSVLEHGTATFYIEGISRSLTHELVRHRHLAYSQLSQRYVPDKEGRWVIPPDVSKDDAATRIWEEAQFNQQRSYERLLERMAEVTTHITDPVSQRKHARQAARSVLTNSTETRIVVTGNYRAWRHVFRLRCALAADTEIRRLMIGLLEEMKAHVPAIFDDFKIDRVGDEDYAYTLLTAG